MKRLTIVAVTVVCGFGMQTVWLSAQGGGTDKEGRGPLVSRAVRHDASPPLREATARPNPLRGLTGEVNPISTPPRRQRPNLPGPADPARQSAARPVPSASFTPAPLLTFEGLSDADNAALGAPTVVPPDTEGDIGPNHYVQWVNLAINVWEVQRDAGGNPTGVTQATGFPKPGNAVFAGLGGLCDTENRGDPIVLYDHLADRWLLSQFAIDSNGSIVSQCVAVSTTPDPTGSYFRWEFDVTPGSTDENDYPKFGLMPDAYYFSSRDFPSTNGFFAGAGAFDRAAMLAGAPSPTFIKFRLPCVTGDCPDGIQPPHLEGPPPAAGTPGYFTRAWDDDIDGPLTGADGYRVWRFQPDFVTPGNSTFVEQPFVVGTPFDSAVCDGSQSCIPQASISQGLSPLDQLQMYRAQYRSFPNRDVIVLNTTVDATGADTAGIRWAVLGNANPAGGGAWTVEQDGTFAPSDGQHRWMGSAAMDASENIALGYSASSVVSDPSIRYTTRTASDLPGALPGGEVEMQAGGGAQFFSGRWGDYSTMSVDPVADCTFWYTSEYYQTTSAFDFHTRVGAFQIPDCGVCVPTGSTETVCDDGRDDDCDGIADCGDSDCTGNPGCSCDGDGICEFGENCNNCPSDCVSGIVVPASCGNQICEAGDGEDCLTCPTDCNGVQGGNPNNRYCCGFGGQNPVGCDNPACTFGVLTCTELPSGGGGAFCCGLDGCEPGESCGNCGLDCSLGAEVCSGGVDEDCNGLIDCADSVCASDPACACGANGASCSVNGDCCSNKCKGGTCRGS